MDAIRRVKGEDLVSINTWLKAHSHPQASIEDLPAIGYIVPDVAVGFVRNCETGIGMLDSMVSNPKASAKARHEALDAIIDKLLDTGFRVYIGFSEDNSLFQRTLGHGFTQKPYQFCVKAGN